MSKIPFETKKDITTTKTRREAVFRVSVQDIEAIIERQLRKQLGLEDNAEIEIARVFSDHNSDPFDRSSDFQAFNGFQATVVHEVDAAPVDGDDDEDEAPRGPVSLEACRPGLFLFGGNLCFRTEYWKEVTENGEVVGSTPIAYCVASGEYFCGGAKDWQERNVLIVQPLDFNEVVDLLWSDVI
ncbi:hypothetical protein [Methylosinus sp. PW1]|uniref:hypothetical protein n=1 Tax=Methylosinus sp. PW1 TaxID=107636 RepID=UPI00068FCCE8|nr:hypothetical protein [Methylosinus sp. PW1]